MKFHEIPWKSHFLTNFTGSGGSETFIFLRENNDLGAGPPKDPLLAKLTHNLGNSSILLISGGKLLKSAQKVILSGFCDFLSDRTLPGPMNLLVIAMVWGDSACRGAREGAFSIFHEKIMKIQKDYGKSLFSWNFKKMHENHEIYGNPWFLEIWGPQNLDIP